MAKVLLIIPPEQFRDEELFETKEELERAGCQTVIASTIAGACAGMLGGRASSDLTLNRVQPDDYEAVVFIGGLGSRLYFHNEKAWQLAQEMHRRGKLVAAICLAPVILANAGLLAGKKATVAGSEANTIESRGAQYTGAGVTVDGQIVTGNGPKSARLFGRRIGELLKR